MNIISVDQETRLNIDRSGSGLTVAVDSLIVSGCVRKCFPLYCVPHPLAQIPRIGDLGGQTAGSYWMQGSTTCRASVNIYIAKVSQFMCINDSCQGERCLSDVYDLGVRAGRVLFGYYGNLPESMPKNAADQSGIISDNI